MHLSVRHPRARELASELAALTGETLTEAVIRSLEERLRSERGRREGRSMAERILAFADRFAQGMPAGVSSASHGDLLHDESGQPR